MERIAGEIGLVHSKGRSPYVIRLVTGSHWSHVIVAINQAQCVSAEPGGAVVRPISEYPDAVWSHLDLTNQQRQIIAYWALMQAQARTGYSWPAYYAAGAAALLKRFAPAWLDRIVGRTDKLICSQLADLALQAAGVNLFQDDRPRGAVTPASFGRYFHARGWADLP
jgi:hypothetical protein